jgi:prepilin-type N-terminal cleavage/methylation domain-containing protein
VNWIKCITNRLLRVARREAGFTLIEVLAAMVIFAIASTALGTVLTSATSADGLARQKTIALQLAQQQIEYIHQLAFPNIGTKLGNPHGDIVDSQTKPVLGLVYTLKTRIRWVNDPTPNAFVTNADYKQVRVTVSRNSDNKQLARMYLYLSATGPGCGENCASIDVTTLDYALNSPLQNAAVNLYDGPTIANDVTDETGMVVFAALPANPTSGSTAYYDIGTSLTDLYGATYNTLREDIGPASPGNTSLPASAAHVQLSESQTLLTTIYMYKPITFNIQVYDSNGNPWTGTADIYITETLPSLRSADSFCWDTASGCSPNPGTGMFSATTLQDDLGSETLVPGVSYNVEVVAPRGCINTNNCLISAPVSAQLGQSDGYPTTVSKAITVTLPPSTSTTLTRSCTITVKNSSGTTQAGARVDIDTDKNKVSTAPAVIYYTGTGGTFTVNLPISTTAYADIYARNGTLSSSTVTSWPNGWTTTGGAPFSILSSGTCAFTVRVS